MRNKPDRLVGSNVPLIRAGPLGALHTVRNRTKFAKILPIAHVYFLQIMFTTYIVSTFLFVQTAHKFVVPNRVGDFAHCEAI